MELVDTDNPTSLSRRKCSTDIEADLGVNIPEDMPETTLPHDLPVRYSVSARRTVSDEKSKSSSLSKGLSLHLTAIAREYGEEVDWLEDDGLRDPNRKACLRWWLFDGLKRKVRTYVCVCKLVLDRTGAHLRCTPT